MTEEIVPKEVIEPIEEKLSQEEIKLFKELVKAHYIEKNQAGNHSTVRRLPISIRSK